jgi:CheY-like chemotaxis protein
MARILLVEDEMLVRELAREDLSVAGFDVVDTQDGDRARAILEDDRDFDLLFTDIRMPSRLDGWQLAVEAKQLVPDLKVLYASGLDDNGGRVGPGERMIAKPYRTEALLACIAEIGVSA